MYCPESNKPTHTMMKLENDNYNITGKNLAHILLEFVMSVQYKMHGSTIKHRGSFRVRLHYKKYYKTTTDTHDTQTMTIKSIVLLKTNAKLLLQ